MFFTQQESRSQSCYPVLSLPVLSTRILTELQPLKIMYALKNFVLSEKTRNIIHCVIHLGTLISKYLMNTGAPINVSHWYTFGTTQAVSTCLFFTEGHWHAYTKPIKKNEIKIPDPKCKDTALACCFRALHLSDLHGEEREWIQSLDEVTNCPSNLEELFW